MLGQAEQGGDLKSANHHSSRGEYHQMKADVYPSAVYLDLHCRADLFHTTIHVPVPVHWGHPTDTE